MLTYQYRPSPWAMMVGAVFFGACAYVLVQMAQTNDRGLVLNGILELGVVGASRFYWALTIASVLFVLVAVLGFFLSLRSKHQLVLDSSALSIPRNGFARSPSIIPLASIQRLEERQISRQRMLTVWHSGGKVTVMKSWLPNNQAYEAVRAALVSVVERRAKA